MGSFGPQIAFNCIIFMKKMGGMRLWTLLVAFAVMAFLPRTAEAQTLDPVLASKLEGGDRVEVMVVLRSEADLSAAALRRGVEARAELVHRELVRTAAQSQAGLKAWMAERGIAFASYWIVNMLATELREDEVLELLGRPEVEAIVPVMPVVAEEPAVGNGLEARSPAAVPWGIEMIRAPQVWAEGIRGQGVVIGGQDTGVKWDTRSIARQYRGNMLDTLLHDWSWYDAVHEIDTVNHRDSVVAPGNNPCGLSSPVPCDDNGHGTLTLGTALGYDPDADEQIGVAPEAEWIACRCMERGYGTPLTYIECFQFFLAPTRVDGSDARPELAPHIVNNSWGCPPIEGCHPGNFAVMQQAVRMLRTAGIVVVVSAGNTGPDCETVSTPAAIFPESFTAGATTAEDLIWGSSSRGPVGVDGSGRRKPDVVAPGAEIRTQLPDNSYIEASGTSLAGPHVAGLVALMLEANPALEGEVEAIEEIIRNSAVPKYSTEGCGGDSELSLPNNTYGYGRIDAVEAVRLARLFTGEKPRSGGGEEISFFPNPASGFFHVKRNKPGISGRLTLASATGRQWQWNIPAGETETRIAADGMPAGMYIIRYTDALTNRSEQIVLLK